MEENMRLHILNFLLSHKVCSPYCENEKGSIGILAGVSFAVLALLVAVAIDYSHIVKNHSELQYHSDHASLAAARFYG
jgi:uncharacterized membrane protein